MQNIRHEIYIAATHPGVVCCFQNRKSGYCDEARDRYKTLKKEELRIIQDVTGEVYQQVLEEANTLQ